MPQMSPIYWLFMMVYFILMMMILIMLMYFFFKISPSKNLMLMKINSSMNWMW